MTIHIDVINGMPGSQFTKDLPGWVPSFQKFASLVAQTWGIEPVKLVYRRNLREADPLHWWLVANNTSDVQGAGGYHEETPGGQPFGRWFVGDAIREGWSPTVDGTHELAEMILDPRPDSAPRLWSDGQGKEYLVEICDPCEADELGGEIDGVLCSDFVLPGYYGGSPPYDWQNKLEGPCPALDFGGYISWKSGGKWHQLSAALHGGGLSRRARRWGRNARAQARS